MLKLLAQAHKSQGGAEGGLGFKSWVDCGGGACPPAMNWIASSISKASKAWFTILCFMAMICCRPSKVAEPFNILRKFELTKNVN